MSKCIGPNCEREIWLEATEKGKIHRLQQIIQARVLESRKPQPLSKILRTNGSEIPVEAEIAVRKLIQEGLIAEAYPE